MEGDDHKVHVHHWAEVPRGIPLSVGVGLTAAVIFVAMVAAPLEGVGLRYMQLSRKKTKNIILHNSYMYICTCTNLQFL